MKACKIWQTLIEMSSLFIYRGATQEIFLTVGKRPVILVEYSQSRLEDQTPTTYSNGMNIVNSRGNYLLVLKREAKLFTPKPLTWLRINSMTILTLYQS